MEPVNIMIRRKTKCSGGKSKDIENTWYRPWFTTKDKHGNETRIIVLQKLKENTIDITEEVVE